MAAKKAKKKVQIFPICECDHYDPAGHHYSVSCVKYISNIIKLTVQIPFVEVSICYRENLHGKTTLQYFRKTT